MDQELCVILASNQVISDLKLELTKEDLEALRFNLSLVYAIGFDKGLRKHSPGVPILQMKDGAIIEEYPSIAEAARILKCGKTHIAAALGGQRKTYKGYDWRYKSDPSKWKYKRKKQTKRKKKS